MSLFPEPPEPEPFSARTGTPQAGDSLPHGSVQALRDAARTLLPAAAYQQFRSWWRRPRPVRWGNLRRLTPVSGVWGRDRGPVIDRYYIETFLDRCSDDIRGEVLEVAEDSYTRRFGGARVSGAHVLHAVHGNPQATIVGDLATGVNIPVAAYDCIILTQVLQMIYDVPQAIRTSYAALRPGGVLLVTLPGISQVSRYDMERWGDYWRFTTLSAARLFQDCLPGADIAVRAYGNVLTAAAFLYGLSVSDLQPEELTHHDPDYELLISVRVARPLN
ncbi:MAG TPA: methyltransferase domain-containing protein [Armatimonadota bacterium]|nr:methyltransferase domain-containing protein [Armatimonadota bacterium]